MPYNPFTGRDQAWLETKLEALQEQLASSMATTEASAGDVHAVQRIIAPIQSMIWQILAALYYLDQAGAVTPAGKYPRTTCFPARRTTPRYIWGS